MASKAVHYSIHTYSEYIDFVSNNDKRHNDSSRTNSVSFTGTNNYKEALGLARNGWDAGLKQLEAEMGTVQSTQIEYNPCVTGAAVNIGAFLQGQPENMWSVENEKEYDQEKLTIYVNLGYPSYIKEEEAMAFTMALIKMINKYQSSYNVRIVGCIDSGVNTSKMKKMVSEIIIKDFDERFVLNNVAFAMHPSFFRRLWFSHMEKYEWMPFGYGSPIPFSEYKENAIEKHASDGGKMVLAPMLNRDLRYNIDRKIGFKDHQLEFINF